MNTSIPYPSTQVSGSHIESSLAWSDVSEPATQSEETGSVDRVVEAPKDPHGLAISAPLVFAAYVVANDCHEKLLDRSLDREVIIQRLQRMAPRSAFNLECVSRQISKLISHFGHGANSSRFHNETLGWFRQAYPAEAHLNAGFILLVCAAKWWIYEQGSRSIIPRTNPLTTSDLDKKLKEFGFLAGERQAICRILRRSSRPR